MAFDKLKSLFIDWSDEECYYPDIEDYDNTFKIFDNILNYEKNETIIQEVNNMKFYYNWKAKHYKQALKNADSCSVWVCKALGLFF
jgi:hypothetical protein